MCAKSKALSFLRLPAVLLAMLVLSTGPVEAVPKTRGQCEQDDVTCIDRCGRQKNECDRFVGVGCEAQRILCKANCDTALSDCLRDAKTAPKVPFKPKVQSKVKPGGAETPGTESPNVQPEGGIQRY
jgi:hypothetical protein